MIEDYLEENKALKEMIKNLQEQLAHLRPTEDTISSLCMSCHQEQRDTVVVPCMHLLFCYSCASRMPACANCSTDIEGIMRCNMLPNEL